MTPAEPFIFRNYEYPLAAKPQAKKLMAAPGSSSHQVWQAVRASSAAPYYLDDFKCGSNRYLNVNFLVTPDAGQLPTIDPVLACIYAEIKLD